MPTLYIVIGKAKPKLKEGDKSITIDFDKFSPSDIPSLFKIASLLNHNADQNEVDSSVKKVLGMEPSEVMKFDKIKLCMEKSFLAIARSVTTKKKKLDYDIFGCEDDETA